ncbi:MAG: PD40 domain-containing protein [Anaerolineae bacterium]|nr:PD40 domain-containing protein [Anaerolineae bacterium]
MHNSKLLGLSIAILFSIVFLLNTSLPLPTVNAQIPTPTSAVPHYAEITADNAQYLRPQLTIGNGDVSLPRWSPDGKKLAFGGSNGVWLMDANALDRPPQHIPFSPRGVMELTFSADSARLASIGIIYADTGIRSNIPYLHLWDFATATTQLALNLSGYPRNVTFSPDGRYLAYATFVGTATPEFIRIQPNCIHLLEIIPNRTQEIATFPCQPSSDTRSDSSLIFSPDSNWLAFGDRINNVQLINLKTRDQVASTSLLNDSQRNSSITMRFTDDSFRLVINAGLQPAYVILLPLGKRISTWYDGYDRKLQARKERVIEGNLTYSHDGQRLYEIAPCKEYEATFKIWDVNTGEALATLDLPYAYGVEFQHPQTHMLVLKRLDVQGESHLLAQPNFMVLDDRTGRPQLVFDGIGNKGYGDLSPDGKRFLVMRRQYVPIVPTIIDLTTGQQQAIPPFWTSGIGLYKFYPHGDILAVDTGTGVHFWDLHQRTKLYALPVRTALTSYALSPDTRWLATQSIAGESIDLYEFRSQLLLHHLKLDGNIKHVAFTTDSSTVLLVLSDFKDYNYNYTIARINLPSGDISFVHPPLPITGEVYFFPAPTDDGLLYVAKITDGIAIWNIETNIVTPMHGTKDKAFRGWAFDQARSMMAAVELRGKELVGLDEAVRVVIWGAVTGDQIQSLRVPATLLDDTTRLLPPLLFFSPNGDRLYFRVENLPHGEAWDPKTYGQPTAWDIATGKQIAAYPLEARAFASSPTHDILAAANTNTLYVFSANLPNLRWKADADVQTLTFSSDGKWLVGRDANRDTLILYAVDASNLPTPQPPPLTPIASR